MSLGYNTDPTQPPPFDPNAMTPEDQARIAAQMAQPAPPALPQPGPAEAGTPPPAPPPATGLAGFNAADAAQSLAATHQPPLTVTASPPPAPATPPAAPAAPAETPKQTDELKAAQTEEQKARAANDKAQIDFQKAQEPAVHQREELANQQVAAQQESIRQQQAVQQRYQAAEDAANKQIAASQDAIKKFKFRDYFSDGEGGTNWVRKIGAALAAAAGAYGAGLTHGPNYALQILNKDMDDAHAHQVGELEKMKDEEVMQRTGLTDIRAARQKALADLTINDAARDRLVATQLDQVAARQKTAEFAPGLAKAAAQLHQDAAEKDALAKKQLVDLNLKLQDEGRKKTLDEATITEKNAQAGLANAKAAHLKGGGTGGGGGKAYDAFREGVLADAPNVGELAARAGIKPPQIADQVEKIRTESDKEAAAKNKGAGKSGLDETRVVRLVDGTEAGMAPTSRAVPQIQKELKTLPRAIEQLKQLREARLVTPRDPRFHNAVLAVAATTSAGSTDANVAHEKGTLTNVLGLPDNDAIDRKLAELENQLQATKDQLEPLPEGYTPRARVAPGAATGGPKAPNETKTQTASLPAGAQPAVKKGREGIILNGRFYPKL